MTFGSVWLRVAAGQTSRTRAPTPSGQTPVCALETSALLGKRRKLWPMCMVRVLTYIVSEGGMAGRKRYKKCSHLFLAWDRLVLAHHPEAHTLTQ